MTQRKGPGRPKGQVKPTTAFAVDEWMLKALQQSPNGVSGEIRKRLNQTFDDEKLSLQLRNLIDAVKELAEKVDRNVGGHWFNGNHSIETLADGIKTIVLAFKANDLPEGQAVYDVFGDPATIGKTLAREVLGTRAGPHLQKMNHIPKKEGGDDGEKA